MKALFCISTEQNITVPSMGSERQFLNYANALAERNHEVYVTNILKETPDWTIDYDVCHMVNASGFKGPYLHVAQVCKERNIPVLLSTVYWPTREVEKHIAEKRVANRMTPEAIATQFSVHVSGVANMMKCADWLLPNSEIEMDVAMDLIGGTKDRGFDVPEGSSRYEVIYNGIDVDGEILPALANDDLLFDEKLEELLAERFVLCVGRIEVRKNQDALIRAMNPLWEKDPDLQLVLMGDCSAPYIKYIKEETKGKNILFCPSGPPAAVMKMMRRCSAHALVSYIETPGLVNIEAAALNKPVVVADRGSVFEYLPVEMDGVFYCDPDNIESITEALEGALKIGEVNELGEYIRDKFSYKKIAASLEKVYIRAINAK